tara:strand:+ start:11040 stop:11696 length:657 start_codon:yes stop_codon:yes gene_type:complete
MNKKIFKNILKKILKIKLNDIEFKEYQYWQLRSYLDPTPWFVKKWALNNFNEEDTVWVEIGPKASEVTKFLSKISENTFTYFYETDEEISNNLSENIVNYSNLSDLFKEITKNHINKNVSIYIHSNSSPINMKKFTYHSVENHEIFLPIVEFDIIDDLIEFGIFNLAKEYNINIFIDDFNQLSNNNQWKKLFLDVFSDKSNNWKITSNIFFIKNFSNN